ncbi:MAG: hypothetical protein E6J71_21610, partial [Deltaproteobacteria bacterium]
GQAPPSRELDLQATGVAPRGGREVGWPGVLGGSESARRPPVLSAPRALSLVTEGRRAGRTPSGRIPLLSLHSAASRPQPKRCPAAARKDLRNVRRSWRERLYLLGPSAVPPPVGVTTHHVESAAQLQWALGNAAKGADVIVMTAAVADYRPAREAKEKLKRGELGAKTSIELVANPDLLAELGKQRKGSTPLLVGFAAETEDVLENARAKLAAKRCDLIVANNVGEANAGFAVDTNHVQLVDAEEEVDVPPAPKSEVAHRILDKIVSMLGPEAGTDDAGGRVRELGGEAPAKTRAIAAKRAKAKPRRRN